MNSQPTNTAGGADQPALMWMTVRKYAKALVGVVLLSFASAAFAALLPWPLKILIDEALATDGQGWLRGLTGLSTEGLIVFAAVMALVVNVFASTLNAAMAWLWARTGQQMVYDLSRQLFGKLQRLSVRFHHKQNVGDLIQRLIGDTYCLYLMTDAVLVTPAFQVLTVGFMVALAWQLDPTLTLILLGTTPLLAGVAWWFGPKLKKRAKAQQQSRGRLLSFIQQTFTAIPVVQSFTAEDRNRQTFRVLARQATRDSTRGAFLTDAFSSFNGLLMAIGFALVVFVGGLRTLSGAMTVGSIIVFIQYAKSLQKAFLALFKAYGDYQRGRASYDRLIEVFNSEHRVPDPESPEDLYADDQRPRGAVHFDRVSFGYEKGLPVIDELSLNVKPGQTVALVGSTGAGKTTLVSLLLRFFDVWSGVVRFDGIDIRQIGLKQLRSQFAIVLQEPFLMPMSVAENIAYGRPDASREQVIAAAVSANADGFICQLPKGYDTVLGERGASLSGGERQRLAIARAILMDTPVVILDEPTSALDADSEVVVMDAIEKLTQNRTTFIIAHRLSTARRADLIAVLDQGRVIELGSHDELRARGGAYAKLHAMQDISGGEVQ